MSTAQGYPWRHWVSYSMLFTLSHCQLRWRACIAVLRNQFLPVSQFSKPKICERSFWIWQVSPGSWAAVGRHHYRQMVTHCSQEWSCETCSLPVSGTIPRHSSGSVLTLCMRWLISTTLQLRPLPIDSSRRGDLSNMLLTTSCVRALNTYWSRSLAILWKIIRSRRRCYGRR